jgi:protein-L-isoaspartate(D-aspartate) O-methyltransferase
VEEKHLAVLRRHMVEVVAIHAELASDVLGKTILDERVVVAMGRVPRHALRAGATAEMRLRRHALPIGFDKTISQPFMVAVMTDLLEPRPEELVLEVGTGLGYQAAILAELGGRVWTIEIVEELATEAEERLLRLGYTNIGIRVGNGGQGWPEHAPFDKILLSVAAESCPPALVAQLRPGGRMVLPIGVEGDQRLSVVEKDARGGIDLRTLMPVWFSQLETVR